MSGKSSLLVNPSAINSQIPEIEFRYTVEGKQYKSSRINFSLNQSAASAQAVDAILRKYRNGNVVEVYYDPVNPKESALETGMNNVHFTITMVLGVVCLGGIGFANIIF